MNKDAKLTATASAGRLPPIDPQGSDPWRCPSRSGESCGVSR